MRFLSIKTFSGAVRPALHGAHRVDSTVSIMVDAMLALGVAASLAYWLVLLTRLPAWVWYPAFAMALAAIVTLTLTLPRRRLRCGWSGALGILLAIGMLCGAINLFTDRPDSDDIAFSHRALTAADHLDAPIALTDTVLDVPDLPPISPLHVFTSIEVSTALTAHALRLPQIQTMQLGLGTIANFMLPLVYFLLLRTLRVSLRSALAGTFAIVMFFAMCGNTHHDWGNFTVMRAWQGKCILMALMVPLALLYGLRFNLFGRRADLCRLHAVMCCAMGLSGTGLFLIPFVAGLASCAGSVVQRFRRDALCRTGAAGSLCLQPVVVALLPLCGFLPKIGADGVWKEGWPQHFAESLALVIDTRSLPLSVAVIILAFMARPGRMLRALMVYLALAVGLLTLPGSRDLLMAVVLPGAYWRFAYALVVPLFAGLAVAGCMRYMTYGGLRRVLGASAMLGLAAACLVSKTPAVNSNNVSMPTLKFAEPAKTAALEAAGKIAANAVVLAPTSLMTPLGLLRPDIRAVVSRPTEAWLAFVNAGMPDEGAFRYQVGMALETCDFSRFAPVTAVQKWPALSVILYHSYCDPTAVRKAFAVDQGWQQEQWGQFTALLKKSDGQTVINGAPGTDSSARKE